MDLLLELFTLIVNEFYDKYWDLLYPEDFDYLHLVGPMESKIYKLFTTDETFVELRRLFAEEYESLTDSTAGGYITQFFPISQFEEPGDLYGKDKEATITITIEYFKNNYMPLPEDDE